MTHSPHQALARTYRPARFEDVVGQQHVIKTLQHALNHNRLHHAYLFTGTRGVGKTTLARIIAKCMNCQEGISATPCDQCAPCKDIDAGCFVDLIEVDAASRTKVEDTRELLENVQYVPTQGRFKVYLIDEVHMLSGHSFNALLKTLEEPPSHVKFLLATTDPQKLPVTVLSRCLQLHLKHLYPEQLCKHLEHILEKESIAYELPALQTLSNAASGSVRDSLSLLDQAIAHGAGDVTAENVRNMLGNTQAGVMAELLQAVIGGNAKALLEHINALAELGLDFENVLSEFLSLLHQLALVQTVPSAFDHTWEDSEQLKTLAQQMTAEQLQLYYQIGLTGQRDLPWAPTAKTGFEMVMLRMLAFAPAGSTYKPPPPKRTHQPVEETKETEETNKPITQDTTAASSTEDWGTLLPQLGLRGMAQALAAHCALQSIDGDEVMLNIGPQHAALNNERQAKHIAEALSRHFGKPMHATITVSDATLATPTQQKQEADAAHQQSLEARFMDDPHIQTLIEQFGASLLKDSIKADNTDDNKPITLEKKNDDT